MCWEPYVTSFLKGAGARVHFVRSKWTCKSGHSVTPKLDTFAVPLEAQIELWLQREAHSQFSVRRLGMAQKLPPEDHQPTLQSAQSLMFKGFGAQVEESNPELELT